MWELVESYVTRWLVVVDAVRIRAHQAIEHYGLKPEDVDIVSLQKHAIAIRSSRGSQVPACISPTGGIDIKAQQKTKTSSFTETIEPITRPQLGRLPLQQRIGFARPSL
jgi:hypothetical protein